MDARDQAERWELTRTARAAGEARALIDRHRDALDDDAWRRARLLVSELATNAFRHGAGRIELAIAITPVQLRVCVSDQGDGDGGQPVARAPGDDGGFGLHLVADLSDRWGQSRAPTSVWFELDRARSA